MPHKLKIAEACSWIARAFALAIVCAIGLAGNNISAGAAEMSAASKAVVDYDKAFTTPTKKYRIAYLTECVDNPYCLARLEGLKAAAKKFVDIDHLQWICVGDRKEIESVLKKYGTVNVVDVTGKAEN